MVLTFPLANKDEVNIMMGNIALINEEGLNQQDYLNSHVDDWNAQLLTTHHLKHTDTHSYMIDHPEVPY